MQSGQPTGHVEPAMHFGGPDGPGPGTSQHCWPSVHAGEHVGATQLPPRHIEVEPEHRVPHAPQWFGSFCKLTHALPQQLSPPAHAPPSQPPPPLSGASGTGASSFVSEPELSVVEESLVDVSAVDVSVLPSVGGAGASVEELPHAARAMQPRVQAKCFMPRRYGRASTLASGRTFATCGAE